MIGIRHLICALLLTSLTVVAASPAHAEPESAPSALTVQVLPATVDIDINYGGALVNLSGTSAVPAQIALKVSSPKAARSVSKKNKVAALLWMTTEHARIENLPSLFAVYSSAPLREILSPEDLARLELDPSFAALLGEATVVSDGKETEPIPASEAQEYLLGLRDIRVAQGLYSVHEGDVALHGTRWTASLALPTTAPPGEYEVTAYAITDKQVVATAAATFDVKKAGVVNLLATLAHENPPVYGSLAILAAVVVGLGVGRLFGGSGH